MIYSRVASLICHIWNSAMVFPINFYCWFRIYRSYQVFLAWLPIGQPLAFLTIQDGRQSINESIVFHFMTYISAYICEKNMYLYSYERENNSCIHFFTEQHWPFLKIQDGRHKFMSSSQNGDPAMVFPLNFLSLLNQDA